jgi:hypothetical protein
MLTFLRSLLGRPEGLREAPAARGREAIEETEFEALVSTPVFLSPDETASLLHDRRFWTGWLNLAFMPQAVELHDRLIREATGVPEEEALAWWDALSGHYEGVMDDSDGYIERPKTLRMPIGGGRLVEIQFHPGGIIYEMRGPSGAAEPLAELSGHWTLPGMSWAEAERFARAAQRQGDFPYAAAVLLTTPLSYPTAVGDISAIEVAIRLAIERVGAANAGGAARLAAAWRLDAQRSSATNATPGR